MSSKRGECPVCLYRFRLRSDGTVQAHKRYFCGSGESWDCEGEGQLPHAARAVR